MANYYIGLLSGTSLDAIDAALVDFSGQNTDVMATINYPIPQEFRQQCLQITNTGQCHINEMGQLDHWAGALFAEAALQLLKYAKFPQSKITAIGSHGQTLWHAPNVTRPFTLQIGDPNIISQKTGITTVADFRRRDMAAGGQGAPLAPVFHQQVFQSTHENRAIVNIGGITNITILPSKNSNAPILGFDSGPGNCLMDSWSQQQFQLPYDEDGKIARQGKLNNNLLNSCLADPYFKKLPPKSTGREYFNLTWLNSKIINHNTESSIPPEDIQNTLLTLTVQSLAQSLENSLPAPFTVYLCGGGAHNAYLIELLTQRLQLISQSHYEFPCGNSTPINPAKAGASLREAKHAAAQQQNNFPGGKSPLRNKGIKGGCDTEIHSPIDIYTTEALGIHPDWVEATLFAWLAQQSIENKKFNLTTITGAKQAVKLGGIYA